MLAPIIVNTDIICLGNDIKKIKKTTTTITSDPCYIIIFVPMISSYHRLLITH